MNCWSCRVDFSTWRKWDFTDVNCGNFWRNCSITSLIWRASSLVGVTTRAPTCRQQRSHGDAEPRPTATGNTEIGTETRQQRLIRTCIFFSRSSRFRSSSMMGMTKASVFPLPVTYSNVTGSHPRRDQVIFVARWRVTKRTFQRAKCRCACRRR